MSNAMQAQVTTVIHFSREDVWNALSDPATIAHYLLGARIDPEWEAGATLTWDDPAMADEGRVLEVREPELMKFSHKHTSDGVEKLVTMELLEVAGITHIRVTQLGSTTEAARESAEQNWSMMLDRLKLLLGEAPVPAPEEPRV